MQLAHRARRDHTRKANDFHLRRTQFAAKRDGDLMATETLVINLNFHSMTSEESQNLVERAARKGDVVSVAAGRRCPKKCLLVLSSLSQNPTGNRNGKL